MGVCAYGFMEFGQTLCPIGRIAFLHLLPLGTPSPKTLEMQPLRT